MAMHDSGERRTFDTGAVRDAAKDKPRPDLISPYFLVRLGHWLRIGAMPKEEGGKGYGERNWEKGMPMSVLVASAFRHLIGVMLGDTSEDHYSGLGFNVMALTHFDELAATGRLPDNLKHLMDLPPHGKRPETLADSLRASVAEFSARPVDGEGRCLPGDWGKCSTCDQRVRLVLGADGARLDPVFCRKAPWVCERCVTRHHGDESYWKPDEITRRVLAEYREMGGVAETAVEPAAAKSTDSPIRVGDWVKHKRIATFDPCYVRRVHSDGTLDVVTTRVSFQANWALQPDAELFVWKRVPPENVVKMARSQVVNTPGVSRFAVALIEAGYMVGDRITHEIGGMAAEWAGQITVLNLSRAALVNVGTRPVKEVR